MKKTLDDKQKLQKEIRGYKCRKIIFLCGLVITFLFFSFISYLFIATERYPEELFGLLLIFSIPGSLSIYMYRSESRQLKELEQKDC